MDEKKLANIKVEIAAARRRIANLKHKDLAKIARMLGRERSAKRTNEPTYESALLNTNVITIPDHAKGLNKWTAKAILAQLEKDVIQFEIKLKLGRDGDDIVDAGNGYEN